MIKKLKKETKKGFDFGTSSIDDKILPGEINETLKRRHKYETEILEEIYTEANKNKLQGFGAITNIELGPLSDGPKAELVRLEQQVKLAVIEDLKENKIIDDYEVCIENTDSDNLQFDVQIVTIHYNPLKFMDYYHKLIGNSSPMEVSFDENKSVLRLGGKECRIRASTLQYYLCKMVCSKPIGVLIRAIDIEDAYGKECKPNGRSVYDAAQEVNRKVKRELGISKLFTGSMELIKRRM